MKKVLIGAVLLVAILAFMPVKETRNRVMETAILTGFSTPVEDGIIVSYGVFLADSGNKLYVRESSPFPTRRIAVTYNKIKQESWHGVAIKTDVVKWHPAGVPR
jgi:hypothetical protein